MSASLKLPPFQHLYHLVGELRASARSAMAQAMLSETGDIGTGLDAALANDAADAIETLMARFWANDNLVHE